MTGFLDMFSQAKPQAQDKKGIRRGALTAGILAALLLGLALGADNTPLQNLAAMGRTLLSPQHFLQPPHECVEQPDGYNKWACFRSYFEELTTKLSANAAMAQAIKLEGQRVVSDCHLFGHYIGEANLEKHDFDPGKAFPSCIYGCRGGCFHGVMSRYIVNEGNLSNLSSHIEGVCENVGTDEVKKDRCVHGVGHGLRAHGYVPLADAVQACEVFAPFWKTRCREGILMETVDQYLQLNADEEQFKKMLPAICAPAESLDPALMEQCMFYIAKGALYYTGSDVYEAKALCQELQDKEHVATCVNLVPLVVLSDSPSSIDMEKFLKDLERP